MSEYNNQQMNDPPPTARQLSYAEELIKKNQLSQESYQQAKHSKKALSHALEIATGPTIKQYRTMVSLGIQHNSKEPLTRKLATEKISAALAKKEQEGAAEIREEQSQVQPKPPEPSQQPPAQKQQSIDTGLTPVAEVAGTLKERSQRHQNYKKRQQPARSQQSRSPRYHQRS